MKFFYFLLFTFYLSFSLACRPAAAPVTISNRPVSVNGMPMTNAPMPPAKPVAEMNWTNFDGVTNTDGSVQKLKDMQGKVVILDFWATYCKPCLEAIPHLMALQKQYGKENLELVGLHVGGAEDRVKVPSFVEKLKIDYTLATPEDELSRFIFGNETAIPQTAIFDRRGNLVKKFVGFDDQIKKDLDAAIEKTIKATN
jgi:thiol-disulfide isomerase/thioredoxin